MYKVLCKMTEIGYEPVAVLSFPSNSGKEKIQQVASKYINSSGRYAILEANPLFEFNVKVEVDAVCTFKNDEKLPL